MGDIVIIFVAMCFCLIAGVLMQQSQRIVLLLEQILIALSRIEIAVSKTGGQGEYMTSLPPGLYVPGDPNPDTGLTPLVPMQQNRRG